MKGCYCLIIEVDENQHLKIGRKLEIDFKKGFYVYIGSAMNSRESRVKRHLSKRKKLHWHVDYLLKNNEITEVIYNLDKKVECDLSQQLVKNNKYIKDFGCSDCDCESHLFYFKNKKEAIEEVKNAYNSIACPFRIGISDFS
mgnify:CR=1 FL=1